MNRCFLVINLDGFSEIASVPARFFRKKSLVPHFLPAVPEKNVFLGVSTGKMRFLSCLIHGSPPVCIFLLNSNCFAGRFGEIITAINIIPHEQKIKLQNKKSGFENERNPPENKNRSRVSYTAPT